MREISVEMKREMEEKIKQAIVLMNEVSAETGCTVSIMTSDSAILDYVSTYIHDYTERPHKMLYVAGLEGIDGCLDREFEISPSELEKMKKEEEGEEDGENE